MLRHSLALLIANCLNMTCLALVLWSSARHDFLIAWIVTQAVILTASFWRPRRPSGALSQPRAARAVLTRIIANAFALGVGWGAAPLIFYASAPRTAAVLIACVCAGTIGVAAFTFSRLPVAGLAMIIPVAIGSLLAVAAEATPESFGIVAILIGYCVVLIRGMLTTSRASMRKFIMQNEIEGLARRDALTGLDNRTTFRGMLADAIFRLDRSHEPFAIFYVELDGLHEIVEAEGLAAADARILDATQRLRGRVRRADRIAKLNDDQFAILAPGLGGDATVRAYAANVIDAFAKPVADAHGVYEYAVNVGVLVVRDPSVDAEAVLRTAELALRAAQRQGRSSFHVFGPQDDAARLERMELERDVRLALERGEFRLNYQPMLNLSKNTVTGFEALLRWRHPVRGDVPPSIFISVAESNGMIGLIGAWVLREACRAAASWPQAMRVCVNVSAFQLRTPGFGEIVASALADAGISPAQLEIEITETVLIGDDPAPRQSLEALRKTGVNLALDDFGIGYSSLSYLRRLPFDRIKIDKSFVDELAQRQDNAAIVKSIVSLSMDLGMQTTAEGIETAEQLEFLRRLQCTEAQGYFIGRPMEAGAIQDFLRARQRLAA